MMTLLSGLIVFLGTHLVPTVPPLRERLREQLGLTLYQGLFAVASLAGLALIVMGYGQLRGGPASANPELWPTPGWTRHVAYLLMLPAMVLLAAAYIPSRIRTTVGHPMLAATKIWAVAHLIANGDLASLLLFGSFLAYAVVGRISVKRRAAPGPLGVREGTKSGDIAAIATGLAAYLIMLFWGHAALVGVALVR